MTKYIDKPDSEYTYEDWLEFIKTNTPEDLALDMLRRRRDSDMYYQNYLNMAVQRNQANELTGNTVGVIQTWHDVKIEIENPMSLSLTNESNKQVIALKLSHSQVDTLRDLLIAMVTDKDGQP